MVDCIFAVENTAAWHRENMTRNPRHYPPLLRAAPRILQGLHSCGAGVVYLLGSLAPPLVSGGIPTVRLKYGVVDAERLVGDLRTWNTPFLAGRLHKPAVLVHADTDYGPALTEAMRANRMHALRAALLCAGRAASLGSVLHALAGLSYAGDPRVGVAEDPRKVSRIVAGQFDALSAIYRPLLSEMGANVASACCDARLAIDSSPLAIQTTAAHLPASLGVSPFDVARSHDRRAVVYRAYARLSRWPACVQALAGVITAGPLRALLYLARKVSRRFAS